MQGLKNQPSPHPFSEKLRERSKEIAGQGWPPKEARLPVHTAVQGLQQAFQGEQEGGHSERVWQGGGNEGIAEGCGHKNIVFGGLLQLDREFGKNL